MNTDKLHKIFRIKCYGIYEKQKKNRDHLVGTFITNGTINSGPFFEAFVDRLKEEIYELSEIYIQSIEELIKDESIDKIEKTDLISGYNSLMGNMFHNNSVVLTGRLHAANFHNSIVGVSFIKDYKGKIDSVKEVGLIKLGLIIEKYSTPQSFQGTKSNTIKKIQRHPLTESVIHINKITENKEQVYEWDIFISHASEDKDVVVRPLAEALKVSQISVWFDEFTLTVGDSLRRKIDYGLSKSRYGIVVLSHAFFSKEWPLKELDALAAREVSGQKVLLPVWHQLNRDEVAKYSPLLADRVAAQTIYGISVVAQEIIRACQLD